MEEKKIRSKKVAKNTSVGAKKVRRIEEEKTPSPSETTPRKSVSDRMAEERENADMRTAKAMAKAERREHRKQVRLQRRAEWKEKRLAMRERRAQRRLQAKERAHERRLARQARKDMLKNETALQRLERREREKAEKIALKRQNAQMRHELALKRREERAQKRRLAHENRQHKREQRRQRTPGFGGWLAAVISLGVVSLAMASVITVGALNMGNMYDSMGAGYAAELYEMTELSENLNTDLSKLRIAGGKQEQRKLLTDILVRSELMESALERFPVDMATTNNISSFVNRTSAYARDGLNRIASGTALEADKNLEYLYRTNGAVLEELQKLRSEMTVKDWAKLVDGKSKNILSGFDNVNSNVIKPPASLEDGPFSENKQKVSEGGLLEGEQITASAAAAKAKEYFADYRIREAEYKGDTNANGFTAYNITLRDDRGREIYAQISKTGKLLMFNSYEECNAHNFSQEQCVAVAEKFLSGLGIENMTPVWLQENGTTANVNFVYEQDGVVCYSDMIIVKVCETKGVAVGMEAVPYYLNHTDRTMPKASVSEQEAGQNLRITPKTARLALIPYEGEERLCYEFSGNYGANEYFVYVDAVSGEELQSFSVLNTKQGKLLA